MMIRPGAASPALPLAYLVSAAVAFVVAAAALPWLAGELAGHYYHPRLLALTHTVTLGFITLTIMGASYQLLPVVLERPVASVRGAWWQLATFLFGTIGVIGHFAIAGWSGFLWSAAFVVMGILAHVVNVGLSLRGARRSFTARMMTVALAGLGLTALLGACIAAGKIWPGHAGSLFPTLHAHVQLALLGWVLPMVLGVAAHVYPMFLLAPPPGPASVRVQYAGVALGTPAVVCGLLLDVSPLVVGGALLVAGAVGAHVAWIVAATRSSRRPRLDWGLRLVLAGAGVLALAAAVGLLLAAGVAGGPRTALAYGVLALGWASLTIVGMMLKIVTFLVWYRAYAGRAGREPVPTLAQMSSERGEAAACALLTCGVAALAGAVWLGEPALIRAAGTTVAAGTLAFAYALARVLWHLTIVRPQARMPATTVAAR